jgi:ABC-type polysaccharide/polyol phosphate transport system ATPase subunit
MTTSSASDGDAAVVDVRHVSLRFPLHPHREVFKHTMLNLVRGRRAARPVAEEEFWLYRDLHLCVTHGQRVGIVGANGAGKSTLLKMLNGIYPPTEGTIHIRGRVSPVLELGSGFNAELSAAENILLNGAFLGFARQEMAGKVERIIEFAGLHDFRTLPVKYYSSGMMLRLAFAIATDVEPEILLLDEIFAAGDAAFSKKAMTRMTSLLDASHIAILASHNLNLIQEFCTRALWLERGRVVMDGDPADVCRAYTAGSALGLGLEEATPDSAAAAPAPA